MEAPAHLRLQRQVEAAAKRLHKQTDAPVVVTATLMDGDTPLGASLWFEGMALYVHEAVIVAMLDALEREVLPGVASCIDCQERHARVVAALAILRPTDGLDANPQGRC